MQASSSPLIFSGIDYFTFTLESCLFCIVKVKSISTKILEGLATKKGLSAQSKKLSLIENTQSIMEIIRINHIKK